MILVLCVLYLVFIKGVVYYEIIHKGCKNIPSKHFTIGVMRSDAE